MSNLRAKKVVQQTVNLCETSPFDFQSMWNITFWFPTSFPSYTVPEKSHPRDSQPVLKFHRRDNFVGDSSDQLIFCGIVVLSLFAEGDCVRITQV